MSYTPTNWVDNTTPLSAANLNNLETQYKKAMTDGGIPYAVDTGAVNALAATISPAPTSYTDGLAVSIKVANTTTGAATLNLNGLGAVALKNGDGSAVGSGDLVTGVPVTFRYVSGSPAAFIASGSGGLSGAGNATAADVLAPYTFTSASGRKQTGTMPNNGALNYTPSNASQSVPPGYTTGGSVAAVPHGNQIFDSSGTFTVPSGVYQIMVAIAGGGGGGAGCDGNANGTGSVGGASGGLAFAAISVTPGQQFAVTIGSGGTAGPQAGGASFHGGDGGTSSFGSTLTAYGGKGGTSDFNAVGQYSPVPGTSSGGINNVAGAGSSLMGGVTMPPNDTAGPGGPGGNSFFAQGGGGGWPTADSASPGGYYSSTSTGGNGYRGSGGGGGAGAFGGGSPNPAGPGGAGGNGCCQVWW